MLKELLEILIFDKIKKVFFVKIFTLQRCWKNGNCYQKSYYFDSYLIN